MWCRPREHFRTRPLKSLQTRISALPRGFLRDQKLCRGAGIAILFTPILWTSIRLDLKPLLSLANSQSRSAEAFSPRYFRGVATVVCKLFNIVQP